MELSLIAQDFKLFMPECLIHARLTVVITALLILLFLTLPSMCLMVQGISMRQETLGGISRPFFSMLMCRVMSMMMDLQLRPISPKYMTSC